MRRNGFTMIELSIVLIVIGLVVAGVLTGQHLIRSSQLRGIGRDYDRFQSAFNTFRTRYQAPPGDMPNAVFFWGAQTGGTADGVDASCRNTTTPSGSPATCNGNGNGAIGYDATENYETYRAWQHLANAGLVTGSFSGVTAGSANSLSPSLGTNVPGGDISNSGYSLKFLGPVTDPANTSYFQGEYGDVLFFGFPGAQVMNTPILNAEEAYRVDSKLDDGKPGRGRILVPKTQTDCADGTDITSRYRSTTGAATCSLMIVMAK